MIDTAPEDDIVDIAALQNGGHLSIVAKGVRKVPDLHSMPQRTGGENAVLEIANNGFAMHVVGVRLGIPWPHKDSFLFDEGFQPGAIIGIDGEKVLHYRHLSVKVIAAVSGVPLQRVDDIRKVIGCQHHAVLTGEIPLLIPVRMGNHVDLIHDVPLTWRSLG